MLPTPTDSAITMGLIELIRSDLTQRSSSSANTLIATLPAGMSSLTIKTSRCIADRLTKIRFTLEPMEFELAITRYSRRELNGVQADFLRINPPLPAAGPT